MQWWENEDSHRTIINRESFMIVLDLVARDERVVGRGCRSNIYVFVYRSEYSVCDIGQHQCWANCCYSCSLQNNSYIMSIGTNSQMFDRPHEMHIQIQTTITFHLSSKRPRALLLNDSHEPSFSMEVGIS